MAAANDSDADGSSSDSGDSGGQETVAPLKPSAAKSAAAAKLKASQATKAAALKASVVESKLFIKNVENRKSAVDATAALLHPLQTRPTTLTNTNLINRGTVLAAATSKAEAKRILKATGVSRSEFVSYR